MKRRFLLLLCLVSVALNPQLRANAISCLPEVRRASSFGRSMIKDTLKGLSLFEGMSLKQGVAVAVTKIDVLEPESKGAYALERWTLRRGDKTVAYYVKVVHDGGAAPLFNIVEDTGQDPRAQQTLPAPKR